MPGNTKSDGITALSLNRSYLKRVLKNKGLTHKALAAMVPCSTEIIHRWVSGKSNITAKKLVLLSRALDVEPTDLLKGTDKRAREYLESLINKRIEHEETVEKDVSLIDIPTFLQISKNLGYTVVQTGGTVGKDESGFSTPKTDAENQMGDLLDG